MAHSNSLADIGNIRKIWSSSIYERSIDARLAIGLKRDFLLSKMFKDILPYSRQRSFHAYCIGLPRSGTHSIAYMLQNGYHASHEPHAYRIIYHILTYKIGTYSYSDMCDFMKWRDKRLALDIECSHYLHHVVDVLVDCFPKAKFILTVRDPISWLESEVNRNYPTRKNTFYGTLEAYRYRSHVDNFTEYDSPLRDLGLYSVSNYLSYWRQHNETVLNSVPKDRLLVINTKEIRSKIHCIADFLGINAETVDTSQSHADKRPKKYKLSDLVDCSYLMEQFQFHCCDLIDSQFPWLKTEYVP